MFFVLRLLWGDRLRLGLWRSLFVADEGDVFDEVAVK